MALTRALRSNGWVNFWTILGLALIVLGIAGLIYGGITYSSQSNTLDLGFMKIQADQKQQIPMSPILSGVSLAAGIVAVFIGRRNRPT